MIRSWDDGVRWRLSRVPDGSPAPGEPVTLTEAKLQTRRTHVTTDDDYLEDICIPAARDRAEQETGRSLVTATWRMVLDRFPSCLYIELPKPPLRTVDSITYVDENGVTQTLSTSLYTVDAPVGPTCARGRILLNYDESWPSTRYQQNAVTIEFTVGYTTIPPRLKMGMLLDIGTLYELREDYIVGQGYTVSPVPIGAERIYKQFRSWPRG